MNLPDWLEAFLPASLATGAGLIGYGKLQARVRALEAAHAAAVTDHDAIVRMAAQHTSLKEDVTEIKADVKALLQKL